MKYKNLGAISRGFSFGETRTLQCPLLAQSGHSELHDRLAQAFGPDNIFMDVDNIPVGEDFVDYLNSQVAACDVVLAVIGTTWLRAKDKRGQRRLHQSDDWVAIELAAAFTRNVRVIPILVEGTRQSPGDGG